MSDMHNQLANEMTNDRKELNKRIDQVFRYADSRFDKLDSKITGELSHVKVRISDKQIING
jgi:hypothetical protein